MAATRSPAEAASSSSSPMPASRKGGGPARRRPAAQSVSFSGSEAEEEAPDLVDDLWVATRGAAGEAPEDREHEIRGRVSEDRFGALQVAFFRGLLPLAVLPRAALHRDAPAPAPRP